MEETHTLLYNLVKYRFNSDSWGEYKLILVATADKEEDKRKTSTVEMLEHCIYGV
jgi:hypothetical protein